MARKVHAPEDCPICGQQPCACGLAKRVKLTRLRCAMCGFVDCECKDDHEFRGGDYEDDLDPEPDLD